VPARHPLVDGPVVGPNRGLALVEPLPHERLIGPCAHPRNGY
jgi:hypothetical protein